MKAGGKNTYSLLHSLMQSPASTKVERKLFWDLGPSTVHDKYCFESELRSRHLSSEEDLPLTVHLQSFHGLHHFLYGNE